jgi:hypothetical protein
MSTLLILMAAVAIPAIVVAALFARASEPDDEAIPVLSFLFWFVVLDVGGALLLLWALT